jgi:dihydropteroate synthase
MGALNVSPESFYAGSVRRDAAELVDAAAAMVGAGAALIDVGAMSTAPYLAAVVSEDEEALRLEAAVRALVGHVGVPVSADTARPEPARAALAAGARILNDVTGLADPRVARLAAERGVSVVLAASPAAARAAGTVVDPTDPIGTVRACLAASVGRALRAGVAIERIVVDPGIGFFLETPAARAAWDVRVLGDLPALAALGRPLLVGLSRKSFIGAITGRMRPEERLAGSLAATALAVAGGAAAVRTHDVADTVDAVRVVERIAGCASAGQGAAP